MEPLRAWSAARPRPGRQTPGEVESQLRLGPNSGFSRKLEKFYLFLIFAPGHDFSVAAALI